MPRRGARLLFLLALAIVAIGPILSFTRIARADDRVAHVALLVPPLPLAMGRLGVDSAFQLAPHHALTANVHGDLARRSTLFERGEWSGFGAELGYRGYARDGLSGFFMGPSLLLASYTSSRGSHAFVGYAFDVGWQQVYASGLSLLVGGGIQVGHLSATDKAPDGLELMSGSGVRPRALFAVGYGFDSGDEKRVASAARQHRVSVSYNPLAPIVGHHSFDVQVLVAPHHVVFASPFYLQASKGMPTAAYDEATPLYGGGLELGYRVFVRGDGFRGMYFGGSAFASWSWFRFFGNELTIRDFGGALEMGAQTVIGERFLFGAGTGIELRRTSRYPADLPKGVRHLVGSGARARVLLTVGIVL